MAFGFSLVKTVLVSQSCVLNSFMARRALRSAPRVIRHFFFFEMHFVIYRCQHMYKKFCSLDHGVSLWSQ